MVFDFGLCPFKQGHSPGTIWLLSAGHSHRRASGGRAEAHEAHYFSGKTYCADQDLRHY
jgi:hypothetical protein